MGLVCILSTRQISFIPSNHIKDLRFSFALIASKEELETLPVATSSNFEEVIEVRSSVHDGVISNYNYEDVVRSIINLGERPAAIITFDEAQTLLAARLRERFAVAGATVDEIEPYRNKLLMKSCVRKAGLRVPSSELLPDTGEWPDYETLSGRHGPKLVIKPVSSGGTNAVHIVDTNADFREAVNTVFNTDMVFEVEQYVSGALYHCDTIWNGAELVFCACTEYAFPTVDFQDGLPLGGRALPPNSSLAEAISQFCIAAVRALGISGIAQHTEVIVAPDGEITFVESGARPPGMLVAQMYEKAFETNIILETLNANLCMLDVTSSPQIPESLSRDAFYLVYPKEQGVVAGINVAPYDDKENVQLEIHANLGDKYDGCHSNLDLVGSVLVWGHAEDVDEIYTTMKAYQPVVYSHQA